MYRKVSKAKRIMCNWSWCLLNDPGSTNTSSNNLRTTLSRRITSPLPLSHIVNIFRFNTASCASSSDGTTKDNTSPPFHFGDFDNCFLGVRRDSPNSASPQAVLGVWAYNIVKQKRWGEAIMVTRIFEMHINVFLGWGSQSSQCPYTSPSEMKWY